jgi:hypothetical protein
MAQPSVYKRFMLYPFRLGDKWGYSDYKGEIKIPTNYDGVGVTIFNTKKNSFGYVKKDGYCFFIYGNGERVDSNLYKSISLNHHFGYKVVNLKGELVYLDKKLNIEENPYTNWCDGVLDDPSLSFYKKDGKFGCVLNHRRSKMPPVWDSYSQPREAEFAIVESNGKKGVIGADGKLIVPLHYEDLQIHQNNLNFIIAKYKGKYGVIDPKNQVRIPFNYDKISSKYGMFKVSKGDLWYYYNIFFTKLYREE